jgi:hypothetical protein
MAHLRLGRTAWHAFRFGALVVATLLAAHDAVYVLRFGLTGYDAGMASTGHGYWGAFTATGLLAGSALLAGALGALARLRHDPAVAHARGEAQGLEPSYVAELAAVWPRLLAAVSIGFAGQEALEHLALYGHFPTADELIAILGPTSLAALASVTFVVAALGSLVRWRIAVLARRIRARVRRRLPNMRTGTLARTWAVAAALRRHAFLLVRLDAGRAPPIAVRA